MHRTKQGTDCETVHSEVVDALRLTMPDSGLLRALSGFFKIMGDPTRMRLLWALCQQELCVCDLSVLLDMTKSAVSHQLNVLRSAKLVRTRRQGRHIFYTHDDEHVKVILSMGMTHICEQTTENSI